MNKEYTAEAIEVLSGLDPVRKRPGMYTDTHRPNHLAQEVIDNSVDEALAGKATELKVTLHPDNSLEVTDNGRGMPVDIHAEHGISGVELILTRLHAGGKFSGDSYRFSGGLHGVGISVVNALSSRLDVTVRRGGQVHQLTCHHGEPQSALRVTGSCNKRTTGTCVRFWPDGSYFDSDRFSQVRLQHLLRAKAVLCSGLKVVFENLATGQTEVWQYDQGVETYLAEALSEHILLPASPFTGSLAGEREAVDWALAWLPEGGGGVTESYVNLIPTPQGGSHVNGLRTGLLEALREYCEFRNLLAKGMKLTPDDIWEGCSWVLSVRMAEPQFSGQTKERLSSREAAAFVSGAVKDSFSLWLNQHTDQADLLADLCIARAQQRMRKAKRVVRKKVTQGPPLPGKLADCTCQDMALTEIFLVEGDSAGGSAKQARNRDFQAIMPLRGKILNTWEVESGEVLASGEIHDISVALGVDPGSDQIEGLRYGKVCILADADSDGLHIATLLCALFVQHFTPLVRAGHIHVAMPPLYRIDVNKRVFYALDEKEKIGILDQLRAEGKKKIDVQRFKGLGEMNPVQLRETTMDPDTRRLVQLTLDEGQNTQGMLDMMLAKKRASDRKAWLESKGDLINIA